MYENFTKRIIPLGLAKHLFMKVYQKNRPVGVCKTSIHKNFNKRIVPLGFAKHLFMKISIKELSRWGSFSKIP